MYFYLYSVFQVVKTPTIILNNPVYVQLDDLEKFNR